MCPEWGRQSVPNAGEGSAGWEPSLALEDLLLWFSSWCILSINVMLVTPLAHLLVTRSGMLGLTESIDYC